jgi:hypothetical protein
MEPNRWTIDDDGDHLPRQERCSGKLGGDSPWLNSEQNDASSCRCHLIAGHEGDHSCSHVRSEDDTRPLWTAPPASPPSPPERAQPEWTAAELLAELKDRTERAMVEMEQVAATGSGEWHHRSLGKLAGLALVADWLRSYDHHAAPVQPRGDELGVLREAVERFYRVDGYPAAMQVVRAAESLLAASPATADRTATSDDLGPEEWDGLLAGDHTADRTDGPDA